MNNWIYKFKVQGEAWPLYSLWYSTTRHKSIHKTHQWSSAAQSYQGRRPWTWFVFPTPGPRDGCERRGSWRQRSLRCDWCPLTPHPAGVPPESTAAPASHLTCRIRDYSVTSSQINSTWTKGCLSAQSKETQASTSPVYFCSTSNKETKSQKRQETKRKTEVSSISQILQIWCTTRLTTSRLWPYRLVNQWQ